MAGNTPGRPPQFARNSLIMYHRGQGLTFSQIERKLGLSKGQINGVIRREKGRAMEKVDGYLS